MSEERRLNFLNWRPDLEDVNTPGLTVADNVYHEPEGYKQITRVSDGALSTIVSGTSIYWAPGTTIGALAVRPVGNLFDDSTNNKIFAYVRDAVSPQFVVSSFGTATPASTASSPVMTSSYAIRALQVTELENNIFVTAECVGEQSGGTSVTLNITGYVDIGV